MASNISASDNVRRMIRKLARIADVVGGYIWLCVDCDFRGNRVHPEGWARAVAVNHVKDTGHTVRMLELK